MARINIEDKLYRDSRFLKLVIKLGDIDKALGSIVRAFTIAQEFWFPLKRPIPSVRFRSENLPIELIEVGLAEVKEDGAIYIKGSDDQFRWLFQRSEAGRGNIGKKRNRPSTDGKTTRRVESSYSYSYSKDNINTLPTGVGSTPISLLEIWNKNRGNLPECRSWSDDRDKLWKRRIKENPDIAYWVNLIQNLSRSDWHTGKNERGWVATIDFLLQPGKHSELSERFSVEKNKFTTPAVVNITAASEE